METITITKEQFEEKAKKALSESLKGEQADVILAKILIGVEVIHDLSEKLFEEDSEENKEE